MITLKNSSMSLHRHWMGSAAGTVFQSKTQLLLLGFCLGLLAAGVSAQDESNDVPKDNADAAERLTFMKQSAQVYRLTTGLRDEDVLNLQPEPALRWTNPVSGLKDGTLFFWTAADGRPYAAAQAFQIESGIWLHEFQSLTTESFRVTRDGNTIWSPTD